MSENSSSLRLAISETDDDPKIRKDYRPFILSDEITSNDWISQLELSTVEAMVKNALEQSDGRRLRILALHGSLRARSYSRLLLFECSRILFRLGCDIRIFDPTELPIKDESHEDHPKVQELRSLSEWSDGHLWVSPEQHGTIPAVFKNQIDWIPLSVGSIRPTQGRTLAIAQVCGGSQSFNTVNALRILGRWMRMFTIPNQSSVPKASTQFTASIDDSDPAGKQPTDGGNRMIPSSNRDRVVDCMEELVKYTLVMRPQFALFSDRFSERSEKAKKSNGSKVNGATSSDNTTNGVDIKSI